MLNSWHMRRSSTVTMNPILSNAVGGIKLMVEEVDAEKAWKLLKQLQQDYQAGVVCIKCGSNNIELVSTPRKPLTWLTAISTFFLGDYALTVEKVYHCFDCKHESAEALNKNTDISNN